MPFINMKTTATLDIAKKDALSKELCIITRDCLGKGENWVMTGFEGNASCLLYTSYFSSGSLELQRTAGKLHPVRIIPCNYPGYSLSLLNQLLPL